MTSVVTQRHFSSLHPHSGGMTITRTALRPFLLQSTISRPSTLSRYPSLPSRPFLKIPALSFESPRVLNRMSSSGTSSEGGHLWGEPLAEPNETYLVILPDLKDSKRCVPLFCLRLSSSALFPADPGPWGPGGGVDSVFLRSRSCCHASQI